MNISAAQAFIALLKFLAKSAETQFSTNTRGAPNHSGITCWPEVVQYLFRMYATSSRMCKVLEDVRNIRQDEAGVEDEHSKRLNYAVFGCGNFHSEYEKITLYIHQLSFIIRPVVPHYRNNVHRHELSFESLANFEKSRRLGTSCPNTTPLSR